jgi:hypothetical protein
VSVVTSNLSAAAAAAVPGECAALVESFFADRR